MINIPQEVRELLFKIIVPAIVALSVKLAIESKHKKITVLSAFLSFVIAVGIAYLSSGWVLKYFDDTTIPIACITLLGERFVIYFMYKFNIDQVLDGLVQYFIDRYKKE